MTTKSKLYLKDDIMLGVAASDMRLNKNGGWVSIKTIEDADRLTAAGLLAKREGADGPEYRLTQKGANARGVRFIAEAEAAPQSETPEVDEDALADKEMNEGWYENEKGEYVNDNHLDLVGHLIAETVLSASAEPRTEAQQPADLAGDGVIAPTDGPEDDAPTVAALESELATAQEELRQEKLLTANLITRVDELIASENKQFARIQELEAANAKLKAERDAESKEADQLDRDNVSLKANLERVAAERDAFQDEVAGLSAEKEVMALEIETLGQAAADGQALMAAARVFADVIERAKKTPEATAPQSAAPHTVTNGVKP